MSYGRGLLLVGLLTLLALFGGRAQAASVTVYDDALTGGWANWSWGAVVNLAASSPTHSGSASVAVTYTGGWQGLYLAYPGGFETGPFTRLRFYLHGGGSGGQQIQLYAVLADSSNGPAVNLTAPTVNSWSEVQVSLTDLGAANQPITGLVWQDTSGHSQPTFYLDDLSFRDDADPNGPLFGSVTLQRSAVLADGASGWWSTPQSATRRAAAISSMSRSMARRWAGGKSSCGTMAATTMARPVTACLGRWSPWLRAPRPARCSLP
jgi:hypothetical protein